MSGQRRAVRVVRPGALTTVQDQGRAGLAHLGVPRSGALDAAAHALANRLAGNPEGAPVLESTLDGVTLSFGCDAVAAVTGALADVRVDGAPAGWCQPVHVRAGQVLDVGRARRGVRSYLAISGGLAVPAVLGSASADLLSGLGPAPLRAGDLLDLGTPQDVGCLVDAAPCPVPGSRAELVIHPGPRLDWLTGAGRAALTSQAWTVSPDSNRVALRLSGPPVQRRRGELPSEGLVLGAVQAPPDGQPLIFLADHPVTGGYPVVAVVDAGSLGACAQARPGTPVSLRWACG
jgi:biotin-dependent carboxylase-like uncharacterized protein